MLIKQKIDQIKTLFTQKLSRRALIFFTAIFIISFLTVGVMAKQGINNFLIGYRLSKDKLQPGGLPQSADRQAKDNSFLKSIGRTLGFLPESDSIKTAAETPVANEPPGDVDLTLEEERILIEIPADVTNTQEAIKKIADLISEATLDIINESDKSAMGTYIAAKVLSDYPEVGKVISASEIQSYLMPKINEVFGDENFKNFIEEELQAAIKEKVADIVGPDATPEEVEKAVNKNLSKIIIENLPVILKKPTALDILTNKVYDGLNNLPIFNTNLIARVASNITGNLTYNFDCSSDGSVEKTNGPVSATTDSVANICYYFKSSAASANVNKTGDGSASGTANVTISGDSLTIASVNQAPIIDIGSNQTVKEGTTVNLNASRSIDPEGDLLGFLWTQTSGASIALNSFSSTPSFIAPMLGQDTQGNDIISAVLSFQLTVTDSQGASSSGTVNITVIKTDPLVQIDMARKYLAVVLSGSSLGKVDYLNRVMAGKLNQFSQDKVKDYFDNSFAADSFGLFVKDNINEMSMDVSKSTFKGEFITDTSEGMPPPQGEKPKKGIYRDATARGKVNQRDYEEIQDGLNNLSPTQLQDLGKTNPAALEALGKFTSVPDLNADKITSRLKQIDPHQFMNLDDNTLNGLKNLPGLSALDTAKRFEFDIDVTGPLFRSIQGYGSCRKSWHFITRCNCRCPDKSYLWDPMNRTCGCGE